MTANFVIAIDGPAASGKSSTAQWVARRLGFFHVDSGSLYRAATAVRLAAGGASDDWTEAEVLREVRRITLKPSEGTFVPLIDGEATDVLLRGTEVTQHVSAIARMPGVRQWVNEQVRSTSKSQNVVVDGRDMGTVVFPDASLKIFLIADPWERAKRRLIQRLGRHPAEAEIAAETDLIVHRDAKDATQTVQAQDAVLIDTTYLTQEDQVERIVALAKAARERSDEEPAADA
jgi:cytidylate kinase